MGADVYLESVNNVTRAKYEPLFHAAAQKRDAAKTPAMQEKAQKDVDKYYDAMYNGAGYYRDPYNPSAFLWLIGLSWWRDIGPMLDDHGYLPIAKAQEFLAKVEAEPITLERVIAHLDEINAEAKKRGFGQGLEGDPKGWFKRWAKDSEDLQALLRKSIELNEPLRCSL
jgi:hypothetical protein